MTWTVWQKKPRPEAWGPLGRDVEGLEVQLVHWTKHEDGSSEECRVVSLTVDSSGNVIVEQSTSEGDHIEHVTRMTLPGWEE